MKPKTPSEIEVMRTGGTILATVLKYLSLQLKAGMSTAEIDTIVVAQLKKHGVKAAFLGYNGFPASICISVNEEIVHGIPGSRKLANGDVVKLDLGVKHQGLITDAAITVVVGQSSKDIDQLLDGTQKALQAGVAAAKVGNRVGDVSSAIQFELKRHRLGIIEDLCGHGVGYTVHEEPNVPNFGSPGTGPELKLGMTLAIEPMASLGSTEVVLAGDGWTYFTLDRSLTAQFEHTIAVGQTGGDILTLSA